MWLIETSPRVHRAGKGPQLLARSDDPGHSEFLVVYQLFFVVVMVESLLKVLILSQLQLVKTNCGESKCSCERGALVSFFRNWKLGGAKQAMSRAAGDGEPESMGLGALSSSVAQERLPAWRRSWLGPGNLSYVAGES